jgi:uncharacterized protein YecE (DUF72 family)
VNDRASTPPAPDPALDLFGEPLKAEVNAKSSGASSTTPAPATQDDETKTLGDALPVGIFMGTSSWSFPGWAGIVYDRAASEATLSKKGLTAYARHPLLRAVGIDRSFYQPLSAAAYAAYAAQVGPAFRFLVKAPAMVTDAVLRDEGGRPAGDNPRFLDAQCAFDEFVKPAVAGLGHLAGPLTFQISPLPRPALGRIDELIARLHNFLWALNKMCAGFDVKPTFAVEVRNPEWLTREYADALKDTSTRYCMGLHARMPTAEEQLPLLRALWPGEMVVRWNLHSGFRYEEAKAGYAPFNRLVDEDIATRATLARVAAATARAGQRVTIIINNKAEGSAPLSVLQLARAIAAL